MKKIKSRYEKKKILKRIKGMVGILIILLLFFRGWSVSAGMNDSKLEKNRVEGIYAIATFHGESRIFYLNMYTLNGIVSYCIEMGVDVTTDIYHSTSDFGMSYLSNEQIEYIRSISYFGYLYPGHEDYYYYMAAQELIWEYVSGGQVEWSHDLSLTGDRISVDSYKNEILSLREAYYKGIELEFDPSVIYRVGDYLVLYDRSGLLSSYEVESSGHSNVWIDHGYLHIEVAKGYVGREKIILKRKDVYSYDGKLYYYDSSQRLISAGNFGGKRDEISFHIEGGTISFQVVDMLSGESIPRDQASFEGASYELYDQEGILVDEIIMDSFGFAQVTNLPFGEYTLQQTAASLGYIVNEWKFFISVNELNTFMSLEQCPIYRKLEIVKLYNDHGSGEYKPEKDVSFQIFDTFGNVYDQMITDETGMAYMDLFYGKYIIHQENTSYGYYKIDDFEVMVDDSMDSVIRYNLVDEFIEYELKIVAKDRQYLDVNLGAGFEYKIWSNQLGSYVEVNGNDVFSTNDTGELIVSVMLGYGEYRIEEVGVPIGFMNTNQEIPFVIDEHSGFVIQDGILQIVLDVFQDRKMGSVDIVTNQETFSSYSGGFEYGWEERENVVINLMAQEDIVLYGELLYPKDSLIQTITTDEEGKFYLDSLYLGKYCLEEQESGLKECFELNFNTTSLKVYLSLLIEKMNLELFTRSETGEEIENVVVEVLDEEEKVIYTGLSNEDGVIKVKELPSGQYCFRQEKVSDLYLLNSDVSCIKIDSSKKVWKVQMMNLLAPKKFISIPNTLDGGEDHYKILIFILLGVGGFLYKKRLLFFSNRK